MFKTLTEVKQENKAIGNYWFERSTMRFFNSVIESRLMADGFFITSERMELNFPKRYTVRRAQADGSIETVGTFQGFSKRTIATACKNIERMDD